MLNLTPTLRHRLASLGCMVAVLLIGCGSVKYNDGQTVVVEYTPGMPESEQAAMAERACKESGKAKAVFVRSASRQPGMDWLLPDRLATYRCE